jgi:endonuclease/exonuclease/phosphatase family metal-dependent hydrolase
VSLNISPVSSTGPLWTLTAVYGPVLESEKLAFLAELREACSLAPGPHLLCGDFNQIYCAADKNNTRLNWRSMHRFRRFLDSA